MKLDQMLELIPDCPVSHGLYPTPINHITGKNSNCIIDWCRHLEINSRGMETLAIVHDHLASISIVS